MDVDKLVDEIDAATETQTVISDDDIIQEMATPLRPSVAMSAASSAIPHDAEEKDEIVGGGGGGAAGISEDLIPEADFAAEIAQPETNEVAPTPYDIGDVAVPENTDAIGDTDNNNNTNNDNNDDYNNDTVVTGNNNNNNENDEALTNINNDDVGAAFSGNANIELQTNVDNSPSPRNKDVQLAMGSAFDDGDDINSMNALVGGDEFGMIPQREDRQSIYNVEPVAMDVSGNDTHGSIPNLIVELRFDLKLCFQGIEIDDKIAGPLIALRPIVETRLGQDVMELVSGVVNEDQKVLNKLTQYNEADTKFYNAAKWGSVGMLVLFLIFGVYALIHLLALTDASIIVLIAILAVVIIIAFCLLCYMLRCRQKSKEAEQAWRECVLKSISSEMKNLWAIAANVDDDPDPAANELNIAFTLYYPLRSNSHDKENEVGNSEHMAALRISNGPIIALDKGIEKEAMYDTTADGL